jgi:hypothetical protein
MLTLSLCLLPILKTPHLVFTLRVTKGGGDLQLASPYNTDIASSGFSTGSTDGHSELSTSSMSRLQHHQYHGFFWLAITHWYITYVVRMLRGEYIYIYTRGYPHRLQLFLDRVMSMTPYHPQRVSHTMSNLSSDYPQHDPHMIPSMMP